MGGLSAVFLLPGLVICRRLTFTHMSDPRSSPIFGMILVITLYMIDNLANCMTNPIFTMIAGALGTTIVANDSLGPEIAVDQNEGKHKTLYVRRRLWPPPVTTSVREGAPPCIP